MIAITRNYSVIRILYVYLFIQHNQIIKEADTFVSAHSDLVTAGGFFLTYQAERAAAENGDISPLFLGGMEDRIHSVCAAACAMNGNSSFDMLSDHGFDLNSVKVPWWSRYFDRRMSNQLQTETDSRDPRDCADHDMQIDQAAILNERMGTLPDVYYYSVPCSYTKKSGDS